jgi:hypothetical protein
MRNLTSAVALLIAATTLTVSTADKPKPVSAGNGTLIIGAYPRQFWIIDEAT